MKNGFSLVELSIVLVILGLLTGGILAGQSLIRAAELRSVSTEYQRYVTAVHSFRDKYFQLPGDMNNATGFWGKNATDCNGDTGTVATPGTCNGNADGSIPWDNGGAAGATREMHRFWQHLALAGLIEGTYTGLAGSGGGSATVTPGTNSPRSKLTNAGWGMAGQNCGGGAGCYYNNVASYYGNYFSFGTAAVSNTPITGVLKPEEAWNIDTKLDDGKPATGTIMPYWSSVNYCATSANNADTTGAYYLAGTATNCSLYFVKLF